ncbi:MAG: glycosyl hydrolase family 65 protein [Christensenellales bacterium]
MKRFVPRLLYIVPYFASWAKIKKPFNVPKHTIDKDGLGIVYDVKPNVAYANHVEMSGFYCSSIISYGVKKNGELRMLRHTVFPTLRKKPNVTIGSLDGNFRGIKILVDGKNSREIVDKFIFDGTLNVLSKSGDVKVVRKLFPANDCKALIERITLTNDGTKEVTITLKSCDVPKITLSCFGNNGERYKLFTQQSARQVTLRGSESVCVDVAYMGQRLNENEIVDFDKEQSLRTKLIKNLDDTMIVETPDEQINLMARYAKIRSAESIYKTKAGLMHSPGGGSYYAALWTNDQCEYVNPLFAYMGYETSVKQSVNCYDMYRKYVSSNEALITSIIAEGDGIWHGAKDRGDSAMYAYGLSRFLLAYGDENLAQSFVEPIDKCLEYTLSQITDDGVVRSDSDELENRLESGNANLCTSTLAYDALISASYLHKELGNRPQAERYEKAADELKENIIKYFSKNVEGFDTYMYCKEEPRLRSWIAMPMVVGIFERSEGSKDALLSSKLRNGEGLLSRSGDKTFWDRSTLYTLRGLFNAGYGNDAVELLEKYSESRLLGEHIPYAVEAFPEGNQAQLSAESGLYLRIFTEGVLGIRPIGLGKLSITPHLPDKWNSCTIKKLKFAGKQVDITVNKQADAYSLTLVVDDEKSVAVGKTFDVDCKSQNPIVAIN